MNIKLENIKKKIISIKGFLFKDSANSTLTIIIVLTFLAMLGIEIITDCNLLARHPVCSSLTASIYAILVLINLLSIFVLSAVGKMKM